MIKVENVVRHFEINKEAAQNYIIDTRQTTLLTLPTFDIHRKLLEPMLDTIEEHLGIKFTESQLLSILSCYPIIAIQVERACPSENTDTRDLLFNAISFFYLDCEFPRFGDNVDPEDFKRTLKEMIEKFGGF